MAHNDLKKIFIIKSDLKKVPSAVAKILSILKKRHIDDKPLQDIKLALSEAVINSIRHGNEGNRRLRVGTELFLTEGEVRLRVWDEGKGYDYNKVPDPTLDENIEKGHGRGIFLIRRLMDKVSFNKTGSQIEMIKFIR